MTNHETFRFWRTEYSHNCIIFADFCIFNHIWWKRFIGKTGHLHLFYVCFLTSVSAWGEATTPVYLKISKDYVVNLKFLGNKFLLRTLPIAKHILLTPKWFCKTCEANIFDFRFNMFYI